MFDMQNKPMRLKYIVDLSDRIVDAGPVRFEEPWYDDWLESMVKSTEDVNFFIVTETTDIFDDEDPPLVETMNGHNMRTQHTVVEYREEPGWRCLECNARSPMWSTTKLVFPPPKMANFCTGTRFCQSTIHTNDCPKWEE